VAEVAGVLVDVFSGVDAILKQEGVELDHTSRPRRGRPCPSKNEEDTTSPEARPPSLSLANTARLPTSACSPATGSITTKSRKATMAPSPNTRS